MPALPISPNFGSGGSGLTPNGSSDLPSLAQLLRAIADSMSAVGAVQTGVAVAAHTATLTEPGLIQAVQATAATSAGPKAIILSGAPNAGQVLVEYTDGIPTLTFNASDAVTEAAIQQAIATVASAAV